MAIKVGTRVKLRKNVLQRHAKSVPAHAGYTREQFAWRETLDELEGQTGKVTRVFPKSDFLNVDFDGHLIGINKSELVVEGESEFEPPYRIEQWVERDRAWIALYDANDALVFELWDDDVNQAVEDGFLDMKNPEESMVEMAIDRGFLKG